MCHKAIQNKRLIKHMCLVCEENPMNYRLIYKFGIWLSEGEESHNTPDGCFKNLVQWRCVHYKRIFKCCLSWVSHEYIIWIASQPWCNRQKDSTFQISKIISYLLLHKTSKLSPDSMTFLSGLGSARKVYWLYYVGSLRKFPWSRRLIQWATVVPPIALQFHGHCHQGSVSPAGWNLGS